MTEKSYPRGHRDAVAWQFRQRSAVGKGPQSQAPFGDWCGIDRETYDMYIEVPNNLVEVRALTVLGSEQAVNRIEALEAALREIAEDDPGLSGDIARAALEPEQDK